MPKASHKQVEGRKKYGTLVERAVKAEDAIRAILDAWDKFEAEQLQLDEGVSQAIAAARSLNLTDDQSQPTAPNDCGRKGGNCQCSSAEECHS